MQTPKEYAEELVLEMYNAQDEKLRWMPDAINCAKVAVTHLLRIASNERMKIGRNGLSDFEFCTETLTELNKM